uniref:Uncharacterized protein n=1 Tax=Anguilla anguilla TaxID=7936 RepID=A0A0E9SWR0_ANGAN
MFAQGGENYLCLKTNCFAQQSARNCIRKFLSVCQVRYSEHSRSRE